jgi:hypothetical protein
MNLYYQKYLKYKEKYNLLKNQFGGLRFIINGKEMDGIHLQERLNDGFVYKGIRDGQIYYQIQNFIENEHYFEIAPGLYEESGSDVDLVGSDVNSEVDSEFDSDAELELRDKLELSAHNTEYGIIDGKMYLFKSIDEFLTKKSEYLHAVEMSNQSKIDLEEKQKKLSGEFKAQTLRILAQRKFDSAKITDLLNTNNLKTIIEKIKLIDIHNKMDEATFHKNFSELSKLSTQINQINAQIDRLFIEKEDLIKRL